jgi:class 3 adenylate cyclase
LSAPVVVDATGEVYGDVPNTAARVQAVAEPSAVLITAQVQRQVAGLFVVEERGCQQLKGVPEPVTLFRLETAEMPIKRGFFDGPAVFLHGSLHDSDRAGKNTRVCY